MASEDGHVVVVSGPEGVALFVEEARAACFALNRFSDAGPYADLNNLYFFVRRGTVESLETAMKSHLVTNAFRVVAQATIMRLTDERDVAVQASLIKEALEGADSL